MPYSRSLSVFVVSVILVLFNLPGSPPALHAQERVGLEEILEMSLEELMGVTVAIGGITRMDLFGVPASVTVISSEDIEMTPARNIADLLEAYVPGLMLFFQKDLGQSIRMRGLGTRNYKTLLLVNGRPVNQKGWLGSVTELGAERHRPYRGPAWPRLGHLRSGGRLGDHQRRQSLASAQLGRGAACVRHTCDGEILTDLCPLS